MSVMEMNREQENRIAFMNENMELSEEELEEVAGGSWWRKAIAVAGGAAVGAVVGAVSSFCPAASPLAVKAVIGYSVAAGIWSCADD